MSAATRYYVRNPIMMSGVYGVRVVGATAPLYTVPRRHVIECSVPGAAPWIEKWIRCKCIEPYDAKRHPDAILSTPPEAPTVPPAWTTEEEPGREIEREMELEDAARGRAWDRQREISDANGNPRTS